MKEKISLSYIMTTYNKLSYLKITLPYLIAGCKKDEEIVIVDGGSTDGTKEFLEEQLQQNKIHQFISEKDFGEAHGTNKAMFLAKGELLKIITDDDMFDFKVIDFCKHHLLAHKNIDICGTDGLGISSISKKNDFLVTKYHTGFLEWKNSKSPFLFCGLSYMIRRSSVARLGLLSTQYKIIDLEYSVRVSALNATIAFCNAFSFVNIVGPDSNSNKFYESIKAEKKKLKTLYPTISNLNYSIGFKDVLKRNLQHIVKKNNQTNDAVSVSYADLVQSSLVELENRNKNIVMSFL